MMQTKVSASLKAVRLRYAISFVLLLVALYVMVIHPGMANWGSTAGEQKMALFGDELIPEDSARKTKAITINTPPEVVWQWLVQIGQDRAGFYTYTWLENLVGADIHNTNEIRQEWQAVGDGWRLLPPDYLGGVGKDAMDPLLMSEQSHALVFEMFGAYVIEPIDGHTSRLFVRGESGPANMVTTMLLDPLVFTLERRMLVGLKARAEGRPDAPPVFMAMARLGWTAAGITVAALFLMERRRRYWLALPVLVTLPALLMGNDLQAALAAFIASGIIVLGFLILGRSWWGPLLVIGSIVMLTLLLAPEAYVAIGLTFDALLLAALGVTIASRARFADSAARGLATPSR